ncbi:MAG: DNA polymerase/3'-5' exonuclease PolX [Bacteroidetes bacterium CG12_big_fil_rev_8_21_14_0_65_60_17]|nr:MAG: DNA polymerase/3'-5' exonuclease PolX [Bacteroidetes bacterium CG12_big_fil_rev_8_21_14_0_65_60_17]
MTNKEIARLLKETAALLELTGANPFRVRAFSGAARTIERMQERLVDVDDLTTITGIGRGLASQIGEILARGSFDVRDELLGAVPPGVLDILAVKGLGAKKARVLWQELGVVSLDDLEQAAGTGRVAELDGFGARSQTSILEGVATLRRFMGRQRLADAVGTATRLSDSIQAECPSVENVLFTGDVRRNVNDVGCIDLLIVTGDGHMPHPMPAVLPSLSPGMANGLECIQGKLESGLEIRVSATKPERTGWSLARSTGPESFRTLFSEQPVPGTEQDVFAAGGLSWIPPELRDLPNAARRTKALAALELVTLSDLEGCLHNHSTYSDGAHSLEEMAHAARERGYSYFGICDHSQSLRVASGMSPDTVRRQQAEIRRLNDRFAEDGGPPFRIFSGVESDILADGSLDYDDDVLALFDFIVASIHTGFNMTRDEATRRLVTAVENPWTRILGHPTGRLILRRNGYDIDHEAVLEACAKNDVAVELNANPYRLDLDWTWVERARELGVLVSINPDAHSIDQLDLTGWGVRAARKGGLQAGECLNTFSADAFARWASRS